jgi:hypothetical protein
LFEKLVEVDDACSGVPARRTRRAGRARHDR